MEIESLRRTASLEIDAWTVARTPIPEANSGLLEAYRTRSESEKDAFVEVLIGRIVEISLLASSSA
jgi:hypothetical protein